MKIIFKNIFSSPSYLALIFSTLALIVAFSLEFIFDLIPCHLCILQRYGYIAVLLFAILGIKYKKKNIFSILVVISFIITFGITLWHKGIEAYWWSPTTECVEMSINTATFQEELDKANNEKPMAACDQLSPVLFNITLVEWSLLYSLLGLLSVSFLLIKKTNKWKRI